MNFIKLILTDSTGNPSSKRAVMFVILGLIIAIVVQVQFLGKTLNDKIWEDLFYALMGTCGMVTSEFFTKRSVRNEGSDK